jgi:hypothetical protein
MIIANHQTLDRICTTAGSDLYSARRLSGSMPVPLKLLLLALVDERGCLAMPARALRSTEGRP